MCSIHLPLPQLLLHSTELKEAILLLFGVHGQLDVNLIHVNIAQNHIAYAL